MNNKLLKFLVVLVIVSICFSVALCLYSAQIDVGMSHHNHVVNLDQHLMMANSLNVFVVPFNILVSLLFLVFLVFYNQVFLDVLLVRILVREDLSWKIKQTDKFGSVEPRSPPKY